MSEIKAIETRWNGIQFRSRLEARWAVFFDRLGVRYLYEPEAYSLPPITATPPDAFGSEDVCYLPDFLIPAQPRYPDQLWIEVKGVANPSGCAKLERLVFHTRNKGVMVYGLPSEEDIRTQHCGLDDGLRVILRDEQPGHDPELVEDFPYQFCQCQHCGAFGFEYLGRSERIGCRCAPGGHKEYTSDAPAILAALDAARAERFGT